MLSNHLILSGSLLLLPLIFPSIRVFSNESALRMKWPKYWSFSISPSNGYTGLISFRIDWHDLLASPRRPLESPLYVMTNVMTKVDVKIRLRIQFLNEPVVISREVRKLHLPRDLHYPAYLQPQKASESFQKNLPCVPVIASTSCVLISPPGFFQGTGINCNLASKSLPSLSCWLLLLCLYTPSSMPQMKIQASCVSPVPREVLSLLLP